MNQHMSKSRLAALSASLLFLSCSSDDTAQNGAPVKGDGSAGGADSGTVSTEGGACTQNVTPSSNDVEAIQTAFDTVKSNGVVCLAPGTYTLKNHVTLGRAQNVKLRGTGKTREEVILDFDGQTSGEEGILVTAPGFTIENLWIKNTSGNGIKVQANNSVFRNIKVGWDHPGAGIGDAGPTSGAYAIYPTSAENTLMEDNEVYGAADAGIYAGQCKHVIARRNNSHDNVLGIEIENSISAEVYDNDVHHNTTGFLLDLLPNLQQTVAHDYLVHDNHVHDNNLPNFAQANTLAGTAPQGTGVLVLCPTDVEIKNNNIENNGGVGVIVVSYDIIDILSVINGGTPSTPDPNTSRWPERIYIHDNTYANNGNDPQGAYALFGVGPDGGKKTIPYNVLWDGITKPIEGGKATSESAKICLGTTEQASFVNFHADTSISKPEEWSTDPTPNKCTLPEIPPLAP